MEDQNPNKDELYVNNELKVAFYNATLSEITRYRNREWAIPGLFIVAMVTIIGFIINNPEMNFIQKNALGLFLRILAIANTYYSLFTHCKLAEQRVVRNQFELDNNLRAYKEKISPKDCKKERKYDLHSEWLNGFWDHILPFVVIGWFLFLYGRWELFGSRFIYILHLIFRILFFF